MSAAIKNGGQAFPVADPQAVHAIAAAAIEGITDGAERDRLYTQVRGQAAQGLTVRDYFAAHEPIDPNESIGVMLAEALAGRVFPVADEGFPDQKAYALAVAIFWADAEAAYRYLRADSMLRAREGGDTK